MAKRETAELLWRIGETAMAWRGARAADEADALVTTYRGLLAELGARGMDADALDPMDALPDVLMPPGWRSEEPPAAPGLPCDDDWRSAQLQDAYDAAMGQHEATVRAMARS